MILTTAAIVAQASPSPSPSVITNAKAWLASLAQGKVLDPTQLTDQLKAALTPDAVAGGATTLQAAGGVTSVDFVRSGSMNGNTVYVFSVATAKGTPFTFVYAVDDASGKISGLFLRPASPQ